ncbi:demethoxyubiquinone hydroxylase family protein [Sneathiella sp.]|uniref:demethoxyubiquinone hydroxylase family protein n=1 Tax=Sneathiella sp. TaxID=1964365 RepID=UPI00345D0788
MLSLLLYSSLMYGKEIMTFSTLRPAKKTAEKMIKVDHAGENGAVNIYRAQRTVALFRSCSRSAFMRQIIEFA